ncbi:MAG: hypothetical protein A3F14_02190 [Gammaproteobacteria bacterium RIFCSPHIGHO2_12_FULL_43_28]|nr:MAG: hypothetical protein A3F14_02190 [Gammaproteobacteria bacterium RIFCSPHIGHO2_12_FULL_43_28]
MATFDLDENSAKYQIRAFKPGHLQVNETVYSRSLIVTPESLIEHWTPTTVAELQPDAFKIITELKPDILLIGTGENMVLLPIELYGELINLGIGVEVMDTSAACRTYNALSSENRRVAAALLIR